MFVFLVILHLICVLCVMKKNCSKHLQKCERVTLLGSWQSLGLLWVLSSGQCQLWEKVEGKTGLFGRKMRALDQCGSCVRVAMARILSDTDQTLPLSDSEPQEISSVAGRCAGGQGVLEGLVGIVYRS